MLSDVGFRSLSMIPSIGSQKKLKVNLKSKKSELPKSIPLLSILSDEGACAVHETQAQLSKAFIAGSRDLPLDPKAKHRFPTICKTFLRLSMFARNMF